MKATVFGAGNIGRGLVGLVLWEAGYDVTYVDADAAHVARLSEAGEFSIIPPSGETKLVPVHRVLAADDHEAVAASVASSEVVATAVGERILRFVAEPISQGLARTSVPFVNVLACENAHPNSPLLRQYVAELGPIGPNVGFPEVIVDRIVSSDSGDLDLRVEPMYEFLVDLEAWTGVLPPDGPQGVSPIDAYIVRKLWLVNGLHFATAVLGIAEGHEFIHDAMADEMVRSQVTALAGLMVDTLEATYPDFPEGAFAAVTATSLDRFGNPEMQDPVLRVARNPLAKLQPQERVLGPAIAALELGLAGEAFAPVIARALQLSDPRIDGVEELTSKVADVGSVGLLRELGVPMELVAAVERTSHSTTLKGQTMTVKETTIGNSSGLHARPASMIVEHLKALDAKVEIRKGEKKANAASIMSLLALGALSGDAVEIHADGPDAAAAIEYVDQMLNTHEADA